MKSGSHTHYCPICEEAKICAAVTHCSQPDVMICFEQHDDGEQQEELVTLRAALESVTIFHNGVAWVTSRIGDLPRFKDEDAASEAAVAGKINPPLQALGSIDALEQQLESERTCSVCSTATEYACSDCRIDFRTTIYVCARPQCRDEHESKCSAKLRQQLESERKETKWLRSDCPQCHGEGAVVDSTEGGLLVSCDCVSARKRQLESERKAREAAEEQVAHLNRTVEYQSKEYLAAHGGSWGICKYQAQVEAAEERAKEAEKLYEDHVCWRDE
jgi:hypothetical protein